jgi:hypothetical protein
VNYTGNNTAYFRGASASAVGTWSIGDGVVNSGSGENANGTCDFTTTSGGGDGYVNALVNTMYVGRAANNTSGSGNVVGVLSFDNGIINDGTLFIGNQPAAVVKGVTGTVNVNTNSTLGVSATLTVSSNLNLGVTATGGLVATGIVNIAGGTIAANAINCGGNSTITLGNNGLGGTLIIANNIGAAGAALTTLNLDGGSLQLNVHGLPGATTNIVATTISTSGTTPVKIASLFGVSVGTYPLISYTGADPYNSLSFAPLPAGFAGTFIDNTSANRIDLQLTVAPPTVPAHITSIGVSGTTLTFSATNGQANGTFRLFESTNLLLPVAQWKPVLTNVFNGSGAVNLSTNVVDPNVPINFYLIGEP